MRLKRVSFGDRLLLYFIYAFLILLSFSALYPFWNALVVSFNEGMDTSRGGVTFWPRVFTWDNYDVVFQDDKLINGFLISFYRTIVGTIASTLMTAILAYGMTRSYLMARKFYMVFFVFTMYFGGGLIPTFLLIRALGLMDNFLVFIIPGLISVWNMIIFRTFFKGLPAGLEESAQVDGCSTWGIFFRIILPLSGPVIATLGLFTAIAHWNDWFVPSIYISNPDLLPVQTILRRLLNSNIIELSGLPNDVISKINSARTFTSKSLTSATMMVVTIPIIIVYPFVQKYFVKGVLVGSLKE
ncbi:carbohydrate ABC transporter permease [Paenibacillus sp. 1011MAR3C5]|uniref:carbohydrate ABC transporter permease n=1 Tax=Paenibacillus sp. 1011MAR3C5 TaxID=1675787 RepID=UPI000E6CF411|nr:carbohydrate ABC transporter permease [Paenibacillus sp. 1011MAR3C5]RJE84671.1 carbohydrate ABC transporter permease [Paenibacillus sp. 1011MAR3C5]